MYRRVFIEREEDKQVAKVMTHGIDSHILRIGSLTFVAVGQLFPHQFHNFHNQTIFNTCNTRSVKNVCISQSHFKKTFLDHNIEFDNSKF